MTKQLNMSQQHLPKHVALIMDGNRRWAKEQDKSPLEGHEEGEQRIEPLVDRAIELGIPYLTFWAFATKNWRRTKKEVDFLMKLFRENLSKKVDSFHRKNVRVNVIGNLSQFPTDIQTMTREWVERTKNNTKIIVNIALSYGGRDELIRAIKQIVREEISPDTIDEQVVSNHLDTAGQPDPDLLIRTGRVVRLSGFLIWQLEYAEFYFTHKLWPEFTVDEFEKALFWYQEQKRNFGK
ncbi:di-trans,poly-cis-decaprenylcistransferase [Candidatus Roizmanbacteria bacterium]|nr:di-trans,poly-cis-decaprenylcistransferase [Candidatus Roizmanbacteria bacterium]